MEKEIKICLPVYKIVYSLAFVLILSLVRGVTYTEEIGLAIEGPLALLTIIFCADTYLMEQQNKRAEVFHLYPLKKQALAVYRRLFIQAAYLMGISWISYGAFYWQKPVGLTEGSSLAGESCMYLIAIAGTILFWSVCSMTVSNLLGNVWAGIGSVFLLWLFLDSKAGDRLLGKWNLFSYTFRSIEFPGDFSWLRGKTVCVLLAVLLLVSVPIILKKRG